MVTLRAGVRLVSVDALRFKIGQDGKQDVHLMIVCLTHCARPLVIKLTWGTDHVLPVLHIENVTPGQPFTVPG